LDITEVNDGPVADDVDLGATQEDTSFIITEEALLANASDIDGDELSVTDVSVDAEYGSLTDNGDGTWTFAPTADLNADDVPFAFTVSDGTTTDDATAVLDITEVNDGPVADDVDLGATQEDTSFIITEEALLANASDIDGDELSVTDVSVDAEYGSLTDNGDGTWTFAPTADLNADDVPFAFTVSDGTTTDDATAVLDITEVNDAPTDIQFLTTQTITTDNYETVSGVTVTARNVNSDGSLTSESEDNVSYTSTGFGANGSAGDVANQIEYDTEHEVSEELIFDFDADQTSVTVDVDRLYGSEGNGGEEGTWTAYRDGVEVGSGIVDNDSGELTATLEVTANDGGGFDRIVFAASEFPGGQEGTNGSSDYYVNAVTFQGEETLSIKENSTSGTVATLSASDVDDTEFSYEFVDGAGNVITDPNFIIVGNEIQIRDDADIDYEENTVFNLNVRVTDDDGGSHTETLTVDVVDVYEADMHFTGNPSLSADLSDGDVVATAAFDAHPGSSSHSFSLVDDSDGAFDINSSTGEITVDGDVDTGSSHTVTVKAQDNNGRTYEEEVTISFGSNGSETMSGSEGNDIIYGFNGSDSISAGDGNDTIYIGDAGTTAESSTIADNDPTGYWRLGETSGSTAKDETGTSDGSYNGGVDLGEEGAVKGDSDTAAEFDGKDEFVQIDNDSSFQSSTGSVQLWFNADSTSGTNMLLNKDGGRSGELKLYIEDGVLVGSLGSEISTGSRGGADVVKTTGISEGEWNHVTLTWDGEDLSLYLNGELVDTDGSSKGLNRNSGDIFIGADHDEKDFFDGTIDEVAIFDKSLSESDIEAIYEGGQSEHVDSESKVDAGSGDDLIVAGSGADHIDGGLGTDTVSYAEAEGSVTVDLSDDQNNAGEAEGDTFSSVEDVIGSDYGDVLIGNDEANTLTGGQGDDKLAGGDGDDIFIYESGDGSDTVSGGAGWTDAIELSGFDSDSYGTDWTVTITSGEIEGQNGDSLDLSDDAAGTINFDDGSQIDFDQLEQINW
ncbi:MAG: cadherin-like domain-containing protein, partial [Alphaproteobacteria bacterium]|nr:cadherin-like domain-containing protein [Alphaproteobacteria bacterium]